MSFPEDVLILFDTILFVSENLDAQSHTTQTRACISRVSKRCIPVNIAECYSKFGISGFERYLKKLILIEQVGVIWIAPGASCRIDPQWIFGLRTEFPDIKIIGQFSDSEHLFENNDKYYAQMCDVSLVHGLVNVGRFESYGFNAVGGQLFDFDVYEKYDFEAPKKFDVSFVGGIARSRRMMMIEKLEDAGIDIFVAGANTTAGRLSTARYHEVLNSSKIVLCFSGVASTELSIDERMCQFKGRLVEAVLLGAIPLIERDPSTKLLCSDIYKDLKIFREVGQLEELIRDLLENYSSEKAKLKAIKSSIVARLAPEVLLAELKHGMTTDPQMLSKYIDPCFGLRFIKARIFFLGFFFGSLNFLRGCQELPYIFSYAKFFQITMVRELIRGSFHGLKLNVRRKKRV